MKTSLVAAGLCLWSVAASSAALADELPGTGTIAGTVVSKQPFRAAKVYARDAARGVTYMVYTSQGKYRAVNVLPGAYEVIVQHPGLAAAAQRVAVESGKTAAADFALSAATAAATPPSKTVVAPYEEIYLQGAARHTIERTCIKCHGVNWLPERPQSEASWTAMVDLMLNMKDTGPWGVSNGTPLIPPGEISPEQRRELIAYLARNFGADKPARSVRIDPPVVDEAALAKAEWIEYTVKEPKARTGAHRWIQEPYFDLKGNVWLTERTRGAAAILRLDPRTATFTAWPTPNPDWSPHGITVDPVDPDSSVWWAGKGVYVARLNPRTGETKAYSFEAPGRYGGHTPVFDSKGDLWFSLLPDDRIGKWDRKTDRIRLWEIPHKGGRPYGILVDRNDKVWFAEFYTCKIARFDPVTEKFAEYTAPSAPCTIRRLGLDSKGRIWYGAFSTGKLGVLDPSSGAFREYTVHRFAEPYDAWVDPADNVWMGDGARGGVLIRFDPRTERFTNYPSPLPSDMPKLAITGDGAVWYSNRSIASRGVHPATVGVLYPDVSRMKTFGAFYATRQGRAVGSGSPAPGAK